MADSAKVSSTYAIDRFRAALICYVEKARTTIDDVLDDVKKTNYWLEGDQTRHWKLKIRRRTVKFEVAKQQLFTARLSGYKEDTLLEQMAVNRTKRSLMEAEEKLKTIRRWIRDFDTLVMPVAKKMNMLDSVLTGRMPKAIVHLDRILKALEAYTEVRNSLPSMPTPSAQPEAPEPEVT